MTEKEKAAAGMLYDAGNDPELLAEMTAGATKCFELNSLPPAKAAERKALIRQLLGKTGENFEIRSPFQCDYGYHPLDAETRNKGLEYALPIRVGNNVWIGGNVIVLPGVSIGDNCVIGAGSVVTRDIPSGTVAAGNPCRVLKKIQKL